MSLTRSPRIAADHHGIGIDVGTDGRAVYMRYFRRLVIGLGGKWVKYKKGYPHAKASSKPSSIQVAPVFAAWPPVGCHASDEMKVTGLTPSHSDMGTAIVGIVQSLVPSSAGDVSRGNWSVETRSKHSSPGARLGVGRVHG